MSRSSSALSEAFELPPSIWEVIQNCCPANEASEVKRVIGQSLIEEACDLYSEVINAGKVYFMMLLLG